MAVLGSNQLNVLLCMCFVEGGDVESGGVEGGGVESGGVEGGSVEGGGVEGGSVEGGGVESKVWRVEV